MSATRKVTKVPRPVEALIRGETDEERLILMAVQINHTMNVVEALAGVLMCMAHVIRDEEHKHPDVEKIPVWVHAAFDRLNNVLQGES